MRTHKQLDTKPARRPSKKLRALLVLVTVAVGLTLASPVAAGAILDEQADGISGELTTYIPRVECSDGLGTDYHNGGRWYYTTCQIMIYRVVLKYENGLLIDAEELPGGSQIGASWREWLRPVPGGEIWACVEYISHACGADSYA